MKNTIIDSMNNIDPVYINEHLEWEKRNKNSRRIAFTKTLSIAACFVLVIASVFAFIPGGFLRNGDNGTVPPVSSLTETQKGDTTDTVPVAPLTVIYAEDSDFNIDKIEGGKETQLLSGDVCYRGKLYDMVLGDEAYENCVFAVSLYFGSTFEASAEYKELSQEIDERWALMWERYDTTIFPHIKNAHPQYTDVSEYRDFNCDECAKLYEYHDKEKSELVDMRQKSYEILTADRKTHRETVDVCSREFVESLGIETKTVTVMWTDDPENTENAPVWVVSNIMFLTKEQLVTFTVPDNLGVAFTLLPEWIDTDEETVYRDYELYPILFE